MDAMERRVFLKGAGMGLLAFTVGGAEVMMTPGAARAQGVPYRLLKAHEAETLEALGETLVPGRPPGRCRAFHRPAGVGAARRGAAGGTPA